MMDIKIFPTGMVWGGEFFFDLVYYYFINVIIQTLHIGSFGLLCVDILHIVNIVML